jgi:hypothetical protein
MPYVNFYNINKDLIKFSPFFDKNIHTIFLLISKNNLKLKLFRNSIFSKNNDYYNSDPITRSSKYLQLARLSFKIKNYNFLKY